MWDSNGINAHRAGYEDSHEDPVCIACGSDQGELQANWLNECYWHEECLSAWRAFDEFWHYGEMKCELCGGVSGEDFFWDFGKWRHEKCHKAYAIEWEDFVSHVIPHG